MACEFEVPFSGDVQSVIDGAKSAVEKAGGKFGGDASTGKFNVPKPAVEGSYRITGSSMSITITKKPMIVPCGVIESYIKEKFKAAN